MKNTLLTIAPLLCAVASASPALADPAAANVSAAGNHVSRATANPRASTDARPIEDLQLAAQRLRDAIHEMLNEPPGPRRAELITSADKALTNVQAAMANLPSGLLIADATNSTSQRTEDRLERASANLNDAVRALATEPSSARRNETMDRIRTALGETHELMQRIPRGASHAAGPETAGRL
jgi:hypothetical protein